MMDAADQLPSYEEYLQGAYAYQNQSGYTEIALVDILRDLNVQQQNRKSGIFCLFEKRPSFCIPQCLGIP